MVRLRKWRAVGVFSLLLWASALMGAEVRESDIDTSGDAFFQIDQLAEVAKDIRTANHLRTPVRLKPPTRPAANDSIFVESSAHPKPMQPLAPSRKFEPRVLSSQSGVPAASPWAKPDPKKEGVGGLAKVKFGDRKDVSLSTIAQNNQAAADAIAEAASSSPDFVNPGLEEEMASPSARPFEDKLEDLSEREAPFSLKDYVDFREFSKANEDRLWSLPNKDSRFHENLRGLYRQYADKDANSGQSAAVRRLLGLETTDSAKSGTTKKRLLPGDRIH